MAEQNTAEKTEAKKTLKISPKYPYYGLKQCVEYVEKFYAKNRLAEVPRSIAMEHMGLDPKVDWTFRMTASITGFDLLQEKGPTNKRTFSLTAIGRAVVIAKDATTRKEALQKAALSYDIIRALYTLWPEGFPSDDAIRLELLERGFTERTAGRFLTVFKETYLYADLGNAVILSEDMEETESKNKDKDEDVRAIKTKSLKLEGLEEYTLTLSRNKEVKLYASNTLTEGDIDFMLEWIKRLDLARKVDSHESRQETEEND